MCGNMYNSHSSLPSWSCSQFMYMPIVSICLLKMLHVFAKELLEYLNAIIMLLFCRIYSCIDLKFILLFINKRINFME